MNCTIHISFPDGSLWALEARPFAERYLSTRWRRGYPEHHRAVDALLADQRGRFELLGWIHERPWPELAPHVRQVRAPESMNYGQVWGDAKAALTFPSAA